MLSAPQRIDVSFHINKLCNVNPEATEKQPIIFAKWSMSLHSQHILLEFQWERESYQSQKVVLIIGF